MSERTGRRWTYARSGVDRGTVLGGLQALLRGVTYRPPSSSRRLPPMGGHYAGLVRIGRETLAITTDTVGTKTILAERTGRWEEVGEDIVGVNVNDLAAVGARPCGLVDCLSLDRPRTAVLAAIGRGLNRGLREARCGLLGGETAIVPDLVKGTDLGGTAIGFFPRRRRPVTGTGIRPGDVVIGIPSSGFHANGFSLVRRLLAESRSDLRRPRPGARLSLGRELLAPTRIYVRPAESLADSTTTHGFAHISGGGVRNLVRLHDGVRFVLDGWPDPQGLFAWAKTAGSIPDEELYQTFNLGIGFVVVVARSSGPAALRRLRANHAADARVVGRVERGTGVELPHRGLRYTSYA
ncbi:MAG TPA: phosphoribosylformylglycinamidine cyclo-ligase [Thermoplasmata archaeon]